ncbi:MAG: hypothetical protein OXT65_11620 [Alphaproteobacteria bacterium]|nr:hypothetical protein [Alphaproteobacteria bacterium]
MTTILLYNAQTESKISSLKHVVEDIALKNTGIKLIEVNAGNFREKLTDKVDLLILPGARAGTAYRDQLAGENFEHLKKHMARGMHVLGICAGSFVLAKDFDFDVYDPVTGDLIEQKHIQSEIGIADVRAYGPDLRLYPLRPREKSNPWSVYTATPVTFDDADGKETKAHVALSKGPSFTGHNPQQCTPIATYDTTGDSAIVAFKYGKGGGVLSGPALEVGGENLIHYVFEEHLKIPQCLNVITALDNSKDAWAKLWVKTLETLLPGKPALHNQIRQNFGLAPKSKPIPGTPQPPTPPKYP